MCSLSFSDVFIKAPLSDRKVPIIYWREPKGRGGGEYSRKFYTARLLPKVQPLTLTLLSIYTNFDRKCTPFVYEL